MAVKTSPTPKLNILDFLSRSRQVGIVFFIVILIIGVSLRSPYFLTLDNFRDILLDISILIIVSLAQSMVIIARGFDLSVASMIALTAMMIGFVDKQFPATPVVVLVLLSIALGGVLGGINGLIVTLGRVPPIIDTLGTLSVYRGLVFLYSTGTWINPFELAQPFKELSKATPLGLPNLVIFAFIIALIAYYFLNYTHAGRNIYTYGSNPEAAKVAGLNTQNIVFMVFVISGIACGLAGVLWASRFEAAQTNTAAGFELQSIAASVVGGVSVLGGSGSVVGVVLGALLLGIINNALTLIRISPFWQLAVQGLLILAAVIIDSVVLVRLHSAKK